MVVFDMAGTTVNEGGVVYKTLKKTLDEFDLEYEDDEFNKFHGLSKSQVLKYYIDNSEKDLQLDEVVNRFYEMLHEEYRDVKNNLRAMDGSIELFEKLRKRDIKVCLNTGYTLDMAESIIDIVGFKKYIDGYITSEEVKIGRPFPFMIHRLMEKFNIDSGEYVVKVGDTLADMLEGRNAGVKYTIGVLSGADTKDRLNRITPSLIVDSVKDLLDDNYY